MYDLRLIENFKIFVGGPSRCGKTFFVVDFIQNLQTFCKIPPREIIYVYKRIDISYCHMTTLQQSQFYHVIPKRIGLDGRISPSSAMNQETSSSNAWKTNSIP